MFDESSFGDGYIAGWQAIMGNHAPIPAVPAAPAIPAGKTPFQVGLRHGIEDAKKRINTMHST